MVEVSKKTREIIYAYVRRDLQPTFWAVLWRITTSLAIGGLLSLLFCGQFGIGFSEIARHWNHAVHVHMGAVQCAIICGATFALVPVLALRCICTGILFRRIIRGYGIVQAMLLFFAGIFMYTQGTFVNEVLNISVWAASAFITYKLFGLIIDQAQHLSQKFSEV